MSNPNPFSYAATAQSVHNSLDEAFKAIPEDKRGALLVIADQDGARAMLAAKLGQHWQIAGGVAKAWTGPVSGQVAVMGAW